MLFAGIDNCGAQLYHMDPSGTFLEFGAKAIGSGSEGAQQSLQESYHKVRPGGAEVRRLSHIQAPFSCVVCMEAGCWRPHGLAMLDFSFNSLLCYPYPICKD